MRARRPLPRILAACLAVAATLTLTEAALAQRCEPVPTTTPSPADTDLAKKSMAGGVTYLQDSDGPRYEEAYPLFKRAYKLSGSVNALQNMALSAAKLELDGEAIDCFQRYLEKKGADISPEDKGQVETDLRALLAGVAYVTISSDLSNVTLVDTRTPRRGATVRNTYKLGALSLKVGLHPGDHTIVASLAGHPSQSWTVDIKSGDKLTKELLFEPGKPVTADGFTAADAKSMGGSGLATIEPPAPKTRLPASGWVVGGMTIATGIGWGVTGGLALSEKGAYDLANTPGNAAAGVDLAGQRRTVTTLNLITDVLMGVTVAGAATTVVLALTNSNSPNQVKSSAFGRSWILVPSADGAGFGAVAAGRF